MPTKLVNNNWQKQDVVQFHGWFEKRKSASEFTSLIPMTGAALTIALSDPSSILKHDRTTTVASYALASSCLVIKRYNPRSQWHKIKRALRRTRADRCWTMSYLFSQAGLNVARPVMMLEECFGPFRKDAFFVNQMLIGEELLTVLPKMDDAERGRVKNAMQEAFDSMERALISHGDMKATNLIWEGGQLFFIDLDAAQTHRSKVTWSKANNKDRKRFLKNWQEYPEILELFNQL